MDELFRSIDPSIRVALAIFLSVSIAGLMRGWWDRFKSRHANKEVPTIYVRGRYIAWGPVEKIQFLLDIAMWLWATYMVIIISIVIYQRVF